MSCLSRIGCLTVVALAGAGAWWMYGGQLPSFVPAIGRVSDAPASKPASAKKPVAWAALDATAVSDRDVLAELARPTGPAFVTLNANEVAGVLATMLDRAFPPSAERAEVAIDDDRLRLRAVVPLRELGGDAIPSIVRGLLTDRDTLELAGALEVIAPGRGEFRVRQLRVRGIDIPPKLIPPLLRALRSKAKTAAPTNEDAVALPLPKSIADVRISRGQLILYKSVSKP